MEDSKVRSFIKIMLDSIIVIVSFVIPLFLKYELGWRVHFRQVFALLYLSIFLIGYFVLHFQIRSWKYFNYRDSIEILAMNAITNVLFFILAIMLEFKITKTTLPITFVFCSFFQMILRFPFAYFNNFRSVHGLKNREEALVYGAGEAGVILAKESSSNANFPYKIVGFIDDDLRKKGTYIYETKVLGGGEELAKIAEYKKISTIIVAMPSLKEKGMRDLLKSIEEIPNLEAKIFGAVDELLREEVASQIRNVEIEDLLGRKEISINGMGISHFLEGKTIFITGGAGSIGSELSRQIAKYHPKILVNIDINENNLYLLELELKRTYPHLQLISEICSIQDMHKLESLFQKYRPNILFHAAAHKHVPLMEHNPEEAIKNNVFGTKNVARCAEKYELETMVLISTDKAVNPTSFMGATKRMCELIIQEYSNKKSETKFCAVRFGNVLGSNGSVIPIFRQLIEEGKNLTVTHKDINRYFMTIPEAAQLVIEAGSFGKGGEIFILDMGEPVKIFDLAKTMIKLSGAKVGIDIVGLRPGEKLYEELLYDVKKAIKTENNKIFVTKVEENGENISQYYSSLEEVAYRQDNEEIKNLVKEIVKTYKEL